jgi:hypothetical protein
LLLPVSTRMAMTKAHTSRRFRSKPWRCKIKIEICMLTVAKGTSETSTRRSYVFHLLHCHVKLWPY